MLLNEQVILKKNNPIVLGITKPNDSLFRWISVARWRTMPSSETVRSYSFEMPFLQVTSDVAPQQTVEGLEALVEKRNKIRLRTLRRALRSLAAITVASAAVMLGSSQAQAFSFDAEGRLAFDPDAVFTEDFEFFPGGGATQVLTGNALSGEKYIKISSSYDLTTGYIPVTLDTTKSAYIFRLFVRGNHTWWPMLYVSYGAGGGPEIQYAQLSPTGTMTSDGWIELSSVPVSIDGTRHPQVHVLIITSNVDVDALEVVRAPNPYVNSRACSASQPCPSSLLCLEGWCVAPNPMVPTLPTPKQRQNYLNILKNQINLGFGGVFTRQQPMTKALATIDSMAGESSAWRFWNKFATAIRYLGDAHTTTMSLPSYIGSSGKAFPICFVEGDADISRGAAPSHATYADVLVSHVGKIDNLGLKTGDRLVSVDGVHPIQWMAELDDFPWVGSVATDPQVVSGFVEDLPNAIRALASEVQFIRCEANQNCSPIQTIRIEDLPDGSDLIHPTCDHRPMYHLATNNPDPNLHDFDNVRYGLLAGTDPSEQLYGMLWNDTMWDGNGSAPWKAAYDTMRANAKGIVLDHRRGDGGTADGSSYLTRLSRPFTKAISVWMTRNTLGLFDQPFTPIDGQNLYNMFANTSSYNVFSAGSNDYLPNVHIAVMLARDVSGSDFFPFGVKGSPKTKLFGRKTMGAFSTMLYFELPAFFIWTLGTGDFIDPSGNPHIGHGVVPDENLLPKQSDLVRGIDTVYERALAWARCGKEVCP